MPRALAQGTDLEASTHQVVSAHSSASENLGELIRSTVRPDASIAEATVINNTRSRGDRLRKQWDNKRLDKE